MMHRKEFFKQSAVGIGSLFLIPTVLDALTPRKPPMPRSVGYTGIWDKNGQPAALQIRCRAVSRAHPFDVKAWEDQWNVTSEHHEWFWYYRKEAITHDARTKTKYFLFHPEVQTPSTPTYLSFVWEPYIV